jgi:luciferase family oxidoreductase group 1
MTPPVSLAILDFPRWTDPPFAMATVAEKLGYSRYWLTEHFELNPGALGSSLISASFVASLTTRIRVGTAAILLRFYPTALAAIQFRTLSTLFPGRIDAGFCSGGAINRRLLEADLRDWEFDSKTERFVSDTRGDHWPPPGGAPPSLWYLGSSGKSARVAGRLGVNFGFGLQFQHNKDDPEVIAEYRDTFVPNPYQESPTATIAVAGFCSDSAADAERQVEESVDRWGVGIHPLVVGTPRTCRDRLLQLAERYDVNEIVFVNLSREWDAACRSLELLSDVMSLERFG